jgi:molecular chaperone GrpE
MERPVRPRPTYVDPSENLMVEAQRRQEEQALVLAELQAELDKWQDTATRLKSQVEELEGETARLRNELEEQRTETASLQASAEDWQEQAEHAQAEVEEWREQVLRSQADMDNFRKRQKRLAQEEIAVERERLLIGFLSVVDDLERALAAPDGDVDGLRKGVELTHRAALQFLEKEGVEAIQAENQHFDPNWHEAVSTIASNGSGLESDTVAYVLEPGYRLGENLLRPAKVVVAT